MVHVFAGRNRRTFTRYLLSIGPSMRTDFIS